VETEIVSSELDWAHAKLSDLYDRIDAFRKDGPIARIKWFGAPGWIVFGFPEVSAAFLDQEHFEITASYKAGATLTQGEKMLGALAPDEHRVHRKIINPPFAAAAIRRKLETLIEPVAHELLNKIQGQDEVDFLNGFCRLYPFTVISRLLGIPIKDEKRLIHWTEMIFRFFWDLKGAIAARDEFDEYVTPILDERRLNPQDDLVSMLLSAEVDGDKLDLESIRCFLRSIFPAGADSTFMTFSSIMSVVLTDPAVKAKAVSGPEGIRAVVAEGLRWQPPFANFPRICTADTTIAGAHIKKGEWVLLSTGGANSDPNMYPDPRRFNPDRPAGDIVTFGKGAHFCLGAHLARVELEAALRIVLERFPNIELAPDCKIDFAGVIFRHVEELRVLPYGSRTRAHIAAVR
jgi:cytochrome P450